MVDNAGVTRAKVIPARRLLAGHDRVGMSETLGVYLVDDSLTESRYVQPPSGDLRLRPVISQARRLPGARRLWWAPADQLLPDGTAYAGCQRAALKRAEAAAQQAGLEPRVGVEAEWVVEADEVQAMRAPAYSAIAAETHSRYIEATLEALDRAGLPVEQIHAEYGPTQFEVSLAPVSPLAAADSVILLRQVVRRVSMENGLAASFTPLFQEGDIGSGAHVHISVWSNGTNLMAGGDRRYRMQAEGEAFMAGILEHIGPLTAVVAPSLVSRLRLAPSTWSGAYACWGHENREAALRLVTGPPDGASANVEVKTVDASGNPYLAIAGLIGAGLYGAQKGLSLPEETTGDPARTQPQAGQVLRLPATGGEAIRELARSELLRAVLGELLFENYLAVRKAEHARLGQLPAAELILRHRWRY
jgi:glutamine synthetase